MSIYRQQQGLTFVGLLFVVMVAISVLMIVFRLGPSYLEDMSVSAAFSAAEKELEIKQRDGAVGNRNKIKMFISKYFQVNTVQAVDVKDLELSNADGGVLVKVDYKVEKHMIANIDALMKFNHEVVIEYVQD